MPTKETTDPLSMAEKPGKKWCTSCGIQKDTEENFDRDAQRADGFRDTCRDCRAEQRIQAKLERDENANSQRIQEMEQQNLEALDSLSSGGAFNPHSEELAEALMIPFGGVNGFAKNIYATYLCAPPGSARRVKILDMVVKLIQANSRMELDERKIDLLNDKDIEKVFEEQATRYMQMTGIPLKLTTAEQLQGVVADAGS